MADSDKPHTESTVLPVKKFLFGLVIVGVIACSWVGSTQTAKSAYAGDFNAPFFLMWFGTAWMVLVFPISAPFYFLTQGRNARDLWMQVVISYLIVAMSSQHTNLIRFLNLNIHTDLASHLSAAVELLTLDYFQSDLDSIHT